jgi:hypothetical protein
VAYTFDRRELWTPAAVAIAVVAYAVWRGDWFGLVGLPLVYLSWCGCSPNLSPVNGCLPTLAALLALARAAALGSSGLIVAAGAGLLGWVAASLESASRLRPVGTDAEPGAAPDLARDSGSGGS